MTTLNLIGSGNLGHHLLKAFNAAKDLEVKQWLNRSEILSESLAENIEIVTRIDELKAADLTIIAVSDDAIKEVSEQIPYSGHLVAHTSGSVGIHDLDPKHRRAVFYPVQTFSKDRTLNFSEIPLCLETLEKKDYQLLSQVGDALGCSHYRISTEQRQYIHLAAVFVNNFVNHLYRIGHEITDSKSINFDILKPLISETAKKIDKLSPYQSQTGPALRGDQKTLRRHLKLLEQENHKEIYQILTEAIQKTHGRKKL